MAEAENSTMQEWIKHTVWKDDCRAWYKNNETGRVNAVWPGSSMQYVHVIRTPRYEDSDIQYHYKNRSAFLGMGFTAEHLVQDLDKSPYINLENIDPRWLQAMGLSREEARKRVLDARAAKARKLMEDQIDREEKGEGGSSLRPLETRTL